MGGAPALTATAKKVPTMAVMCPVNMEKPYME